MGGWCLGEAVPRDQEREGAGLRGHQRTSYVRKVAHTNMSVDVRMALLNARANGH